MFNTIKNPKTGKLVKSGGNVGKQLIKNPGTHVYNPITGKNVKVDGRVGKMVMGGYRNAAMYPPIIYLKEVHDYPKGNYNDVEAISSLVNSFNENKPREIQFILDYFKEINRTQNYASLFRLHNLLIKHKPSTNDAYFDFLDKLDKYYNNMLETYSFSEFKKLLNNQDIAYINNYNTNQQEVYKLLIEYKKTLDQQEFTTCKTESKRIKNPCRNIYFNIPAIKNDLWSALARMIGPYIESIRFFYTKLGQSDSLKHLEIPIHTIPTNDSKPIIATKFIQPIETIETKITNEKNKNNKWAGYDRDEMTKVVEKDEMTKVVTLKNDILNNVINVKQLIKNQLDIIKDIDTTLEKLNNKLLIKQIQKEHTKSFLEELKQGVKDYIKLTIIPEFIEIKMSIILDQYRHNQEKQSELLVQFIKELFEVIKVIDTTLNELNKNWLSKKIQKESTRLQKEHTKSFLEQLKEAVKDSIKSVIIPKFTRIADILDKKALTYMNDHNLKLNGFKRISSNVRKQVILNPDVKTVRELFENEQIFSEKDYHYIKTSIKYS